MNTKHAKSPCCGARVWRFGPRRRQCVQCGHTWTVRPRKRGRPRHRTAASVIRRVLLDGLTVGQLYSKKPGVALPSYRYRFRQALQRFVARPSPQQVPSGPLVLLVDGLCFEFHGKPWVLYLMALKPCRSHYAIFLDPVLIPGKEGLRRWQYALETVPPEVMSRIRAMVADNLTGVQWLADQQGWVLQLCHFHLLLKIQAIRRGTRYRLHGGQVREEIHQLVREAIETADEQRLSAVLSRLRHLSHGNCGTRRTQATVRGFLKDVAFFRTYLAHPRLGLPKTTNSVESMCRILRELFRSSRAGSNPTSVLLWATALIRVRPKVICNGHSFNRIS